MKLSNFLNVMEEVKTRHNTGYIIFADTGEFAGLSEEERTYFFQFSGDSIRRNGKIILSSYADNRYPHHNNTRRNLVIGNAIDDERIEDCGFVTFTLFCWYRTQMQLLGDYTTWKDAYESMRKSVAKAFKFPDYDSMMTYFDTHNGYEITSRGTIAYIPAEKGYCVWKIVTTLNTGTSVKVFE